MAKKLQPVDHAKEAASHHTTLCLLDAIASTAQSSDMHHSTYRLTQRIVSLCRDEQQRQLKKYDAALARVASGVSLAGHQTKSTHTLMDESSANGLSATSGGTRNADQA